MQRQKGALASLLPCYFISTRPNSVADWFGTTLYWMRSLWTTFLRTTQTRMSTMAGENPLKIRQVEPSDISRGFFEVLSQLTHAPPMSEEKFTTLVNQQRQLDIQKTVVMVNGHDRIVATGSIMIEPKFIRSGMPCGHIEDIVVDKSVRGGNVGKKLIDHLVQHAKDRGCYKVILDCSTFNIGFYNKCGFDEGGQQMSIYFTKSKE